MPITLDGTNGITTPTYGGADTSEYIVPVTQFKNRIINGGMDVWQRATSATTTGGYNSVDRWTQVSGNSITHTQSTDVPTGFRYSLQMAGVGSNINQRIESVNCNGLGGATVTISLWYKNSTGSDPLSLSLYYANSADNFGSVTQIGSNQTLSSNPSSSWTYYTATFSNISANAVNGLSVYVFRGSSATSTGLLTGVQIEVGSSATSFEYRPYGTELALCQRYFEKSYDIGTAPATIENNGCEVFRASLSNPYQTVTYRVTKRAVPTFTTYNPTTGATGSWRDASASANLTTSASFQGDRSAAVDVTTTSGNRIQGHWIASAEL